VSDSRVFDAAQQSSASDWLTIGVDPAPGRMVSLAHSPAAQHALRASALGFQPAQSTAVGAKNASRSAKEQNRLTKADTNGRMRDDHRQCQIRIGHSSVKGADT
jgi:hypothetical protein